MLKCKPTDIMDCASINNLEGVYCMWPLAMYIKLDNYLKIINNKGENVLKKVKLFVKKKDQRFVFKLAYKDDI